MSSEDKRPAAEGEIERLRSDRNAAVKRAEEAERQRGELWAERGALRTTLAALGHAPADEAPTTLTLDTTTAQLSQHIADQAATIAEMHGRLTRWAAANAELQRDLEQARAALERIARIPCDDPRCTEERPCPTHIARAALPDADREEERAKCDGYGAVRNERYEYERFCPGCPACNKAAPAAADEEKPKRDEPCKCGKHTLKHWWEAITDAGQEGTDGMRHTRAECLTRTERQRRKRELPAEDAAERRKEHDQ